MFSGSRPQSVLVVLAILWAADGRAAWSQTQTQDLQRNVTPASTRGKRTFTSNCASCHGLDGRGGDRAPNIVENPKVQGFSDARIAQIIENGIPGAGMPAFHSLAISEVRTLVTYLRTLQGSKQTPKLPGDAARGEKIFFGKAGCSSCHMVSGKGGFIASDLSGFARTHGVESILSAITTTTPLSERLGRLVTARTRGGGTVVGRIRNEDNFSMQLQALDGTYYLVTKSEIEGLDYASQTLMPSDYSSTLSAEELNDIVSYLIRTGGTSTEATKKIEEWDE